MKRYRDDRPLDVCFARGTFNAHPYVMAAMNEFLRHLDTPEAQALCSRLDALWNARAAARNLRLREHRLPVQVPNLSSIFTVIYTEPARYNWMFQFYLRAVCLSLSWIRRELLSFPTRRSSD